MFRIVRELLHPIAQLRHMHAQVLRSLHIGHASLLDQAHSLKLELAGKLPSLHDPPPAPSKHLTRCLRNRVQAKQANFENLLLAISGLIALLSSQFYNNDFGRVDYLVAEYGDQHGFIPAIGEYLLVKYPQWPD